VSAEALIPRKACGEEEGESVKVKRPCELGTWRIVCLVRVSFNKQKEDDNSMRRCGFSAKSLDKLRRFLENCGTCNTSSKRIED
jgi:hypothetical protein